MLFLLLYHQTVMLSCKKTGRLSKHIVPDRMPWPKSLVILDAIRPQPVQSLRGKTRNAAKSGPSISSMGQFSELVHRVQQRAEPRYLVRKTKDTTNLNHPNAGEVMRMGFTWKHSETAPAAKVVQFLTIDEAKRRVKTEWMDSQEYAE